MRTLRVSETESECRGEIGIAPVLTEKIARLAADSTAGQRQSQVLTKSLGIFDLPVEAPSTLSHCPFNGHRSPRVDRVGATADDRARDSAIRREGKLRPGVRDHIARIPEIEQPLSRLPLGLDDVENVLLRRMGW